ncbi:hypothetical protein FOZ61_006846 [Perkinsus olseni]|uniref:Kinesin motor domain-containing protein n=1 Tax=Perkinsus olseni TaxID=32597 RepID=A0A7J6MHH6_PEROL|nr:hypothetical protein FOZ61_006846 [Perkinsus olseni]
MASTDPLASSQEKAETGNISVAVRIRSWLGRPEPDPCMLREGENSISIRPSSRSSAKSFTVDYVFDSSDLSDSASATQAALYSEIGTKILRNSLQGFNGCLFAYGQTGSGKSYTMHGEPGTYSGEHRGIIPRLSRSLFAAGESVRQLRMWVSYLEIYNEHLRDLLAVDDENRDLTVMEHPGLGVYVRDLTEALLQSPEEVEKLLQFGNRRRAESVTSMNPHSSRSHAVCRIRLECQPTDDGPKLRSCINLIDLAGSERQEKTHSTGSVLREANSINQSLSALGMVIKHLVERGPNTVKRRTTRDSHAAASWIPFRSSKLTFLLKDSLAGNSKTFMIACISPARSELEESVSTLRFAASVQEVRVSARVNVDRDEQVLRVLQLEIGSLRRQLQSQQSKNVSSEVATLTRELQERERLVADMKRTYESQLAASQDMLRVREAALADRGLSSSEIKAAFGVGDYTPYMLNVSQDPMLSGSLIYYFQPDATTIVGSSPAECHMVLRGVGIPPSLCQVDNYGNQRLTISLTDAGAQAGGRVLVNGKVLRAGDPPRRLRHLDRLVFGRAHCMSFIVPTSREANETITAGQGVVYDDFVREIVHDDSSEAFQELRHYIEDVKNKLDDQQMAEFLEVLRSICPLVDEANDMTTELRPEMNFRFEVELIWDVYNSPARDLVVIRLLKFHDKESDGVHATVLCYWSSQRFRHQLDLMRDLYHRVEIGSVDRHDVRTGDFFRTIEGRLLDAWTDEPADVKTQTEFSTRASLNREIEQLKDSIDRVPTASTNRHRRSTILHSVTGTKHALVLPPTESAKAEESVAGGNPAPGEERENLEKENSELRALNASLREENERLRELLSAKTASQPSCKNTISPLSNTWAALPPSLEKTSSQTFLPDAATSRLMPTFFTAVPQLAQITQETVLQGNCAAAEGGKHEPRIVSVQVYPVGLVPRGIKSQREVSLASFGQLIESLFGGPAQAMEYFDPSKRGQVTLFDFARLLAAVTKRDWIMTPKGRGHAAHDTLFGCDDATLFANLDQGGKGMLIMQDFVYAHMCAHAWSHGMALPPPPRVVAA